MNYLSVSQMAKKWNMSERGVRKYCAEDKIHGAFLTVRLGIFPKTQKNPKEKIKKSNEHQTLLERLKSEKASYIPAESIIKYRLNLPIIPITLREANLPTTKRDIFLKPIQSEWKMMHLMLMTLLKRQIISNVSI